MRRILALSLLLLGLLAGAGLAQAETLTGSDWVLQGETGQRGPFLHFEDGSVGGLGGCNRFGGKYEQSGDKLSFSPLMSTRMACRPDLMKKEQAFFDMLGKVKGMKLAGDNLELLDGQGKLLATFTRRAAE
jgi:heat shock protein HslJ